MHARVTGFEPNHQLNVFHLRSWFVCAAKCLSDSLMILMYQENLKAKDIWLGLAHV